jgi:hypothetical protein
MLGTAPSLADLADGGETSACCDDRILDFMEKAIISVQIALRKTYNTSLVTVKFHLYVPTSRFFTASSELLLINKFINLTCISIMTADTYLICTMQITAPRQLGSL